MDHSQGDIKAWTSPSSINPSINPGTPTRDKQHRTPGPFVRDGKRAGLCSTVRRNPSREHKTLGMEAINGYV